jgi:hypothetical protein
MSDRSLGPFNQGDRVSTRIPMLLGFAALLTAAAHAADPPDLTRKNYEQYRDKILPSAAERGWKDIAWRNDLGAAVAEAHAADVPVLLWAMNGDPLGCT